MRLAKTCTVAISLLSLLLATTSFAAKEGVEGSTIHRASKIIGADVENMQGEDLGDIEDIVLDPQDGRIAYLVVSFGGFLGLGEKYFAVPWKAFTAKATDDDMLLLNMNKEQLKNAPGFDKNHWPNMADRSWGTNIHTYYNVPPYWESREASRLGTGTVPMTSSPTARTERTGERMGMMHDDEAVTGTILNVNETTKSLQLQMANGDTVEMKAPEELLKGLQAGDRVEVVIRKQANVEHSPSKPGMKEKSQN